MPESARKRRRRSHSRSARAKNPKRLALGFLQKFKAEIVGALLLLLGIFLLVERLDILAAFSAKLGWLASAVVDYFWVVIGWASGIEFSDLIGIVLVFGGVLLLFLRVRTRMIGRSAALSSIDECPRCGKAMRRAPRKIGHQIVAALFRVRIKHYSCSKCPGGIALWEKKRAAGNWE